MTSAGVTVAEVFPLREKQWLLVHLGSGEWDFQSFGPVLLCFDGKRIRMRYDGFGDMKGTAVLNLLPLDPEFGSVQDIAKALADAAPTRVWLERP